MEYLKIANLLDNEVALNAANKPSKFGTRNWIEINEEHILVMILNLKLQW